MSGKPNKEIKKGKSELALIFAELTALREELEALKVSQGASPAPVVQTAEQVARKAGAFTPAARARLIQTLLTNGPQSPTQLGEACGLATGSLYHHLRELVASGIATVEAKNYGLTPEGTRIAAVFFAPSEG